MGSHPLAGIKLFAVARPLDAGWAALSSVSITQITGIDDAGDITGFYLDATTGIQRGFIGTPAPESGTFGLLMGSLLAMVVSLRLRATQFGPRSGLTRKRHFRLMRLMI
jgi:hypothetical protein